VAKLGSSSSTYEVDHLARYILFKIFNDTTRQVVSTYLLT